jgi:hypothetical protein
MKAMTLVFRSDNYYNGGRSLTFNFVFSTFTLKVKGREKIYCQSKLYN